MAKTNGGEDKPSPDENAMSGGEAGTGEDQERHDKNGDQEQFSDHSSDFDDYPYVHDEEEGNTVFKSIFESTLASPIRSNISSHRGDRGSGELFFFVILLRSL